MPPVSSSLFEGIIVLYELYCDGACQPNPGTGGWAFILYPADTPAVRMTGSGKVENTTNNRMELTALIKGLEKFFDYFNWGGRSLCFVSDSMYLIQGVTSWSEKWQKSNWIKADGKPVLNQDLWKEIVGYKMRIPLSCRYVPGHKGVPLNEECDRMAVRAIRG